ncbi:MAG: hypothetical protein M1832_000692 [Thelocarpon impressellum]|nr:MAG: hypothetical protein M1832_000692 [Thelocarpon impressellum]
MAPMSMSTDPQLHLLARLQIHTQASWEQIARILNGEFDLGLNARHVEVMRRRMVHETPWILVGVVVEGQSIWAKEITGVMERYGA